MFPWDERSRRGLVDALVASCKLLITEPRQAFGLLKPDGDMTGPLLFGLIIGWPIAIIGQVYQMLLGGMMGGMLGGSEAMQAQAFSGAMGLVMMGLGFPIIYLIGIFIGAGIVHLMLIVIKALGGSSFGFEGTVKIACYSYVAYLAGIVPFLGGLVTMVASLILWIVGIQVVHRTTMGQALTAVFAPLLLCCVCVAIAFALGGAAFMSALSGAGG